MYELLPAVDSIAAHLGGSLRVPHRFQSDLFAHVQWDESHVRLFPHDRFKDDTPSITLSRELWDWIGGQLGEFEGWYNALLDERKERGEEGMDPV